MPLRATDALTPGPGPQATTAVAGPLPATPASAIRPSAVAPQSPPTGYVCGTSHAARRTTANTVVDLLTLGRLTSPKAVTPANDLEALERRVELIRRQPGVRIEELGKVEGTPVTAIHLGASDPENPPKLRVLVTGGVHGDEACGPAAALVLIERLLAHPELAAAVELTVIPLINPSGFVADTRDNADGLDINREFDRLKEPLETRLVRRILDRQRFDLVIDLHLANSSRTGFFGIHRDAKELLTRAMEEFQSGHPVMHEQTTTYALQAPGVYTSNTPGTLKGAAKDTGSRWALTLEAPGFLPYRDQATGLADLTFDVMAAAAEKLDKG